jgi:hypothetical protein
MQVRQLQQQDAMLVMYELNLRTQQVSNASPMSNIHKKSALLPLKDPSSRDLLYLIKKNM